MVCRNHLRVRRINFLESFELFVQKRIIVCATEKISVVLATTNRNEQREGSLKLVISSKNTFS